MAHSKSNSNVRHASLNLNKSGFKSLNIQDNYSGSLATAAEKETNGDSSHALIQSEVCQIKEYAKCKYLSFTKKYE